MPAAEASLRLVGDLPASLVESHIQQLRAGLDPRMPNPGYQARADDYLRLGALRSGKLASMLEVALTAKRSQRTAELVWSGPGTSAVPMRGTEQVLFDLIHSAERRVTVMSFGIFQVPRPVESLESALMRNVEVRIVLGDSRIAKRAGD